MTFLRQIALLLPSAFLLGVLLFLLTHGRADPGFGMYPYFEQWAGSASAGWTPEARFLAQSGLFFLPAYAAALLLVLAVSFAEKALFGRAADRSRSPYRRSFGAVFSAFFLILTGALVLWGDRAASRGAPGALLAPLTVAFAPFAAGAAALLPAAALAAPLVLLRKAWAA
ncbi:MAG: hypothetical protein ACRD3M_10540 [Thermoanaerobaculia bacterium]